MKHKSDIKAVIKANKMSHSVFCVLGLLEALKIKNAGYVHRGEVHRFVDRAAERFYGINQMWADDEPR